MTRTCRGVALPAIATLLSAGLVVPPAVARETYLVANYKYAWGEIQGATAPILRPDLLFPLNLTSAFSSSITGLAVDGNTAYLLQSYGTNPSAPQQSLLTYDLTTGTRTATTSIALPKFDRGLQDIATINGTVYAAWADNSSRSAIIRQINADGSLTNVLTVATSAPGPTVRLAASAEGNIAVLTASNGGTTSQHFLIDPANWSVSQSAQTNVAPGIAAVLNLSGQRMTEDTDSHSLNVSQKVLSVPGFASLGAVGTDQYLGYSYRNLPVSYGGSGTALSDAFDLPYSPTLPAVAQLNPLFYYQGDPRTTHLLRRPGASFSAPVSISNYAAPDATTVDQVVATSVAWNQLAGASPIQVTAALDPAGDLSTRSIAQATFSLPAGSPTARGVYTFVPDVTLQGRYTTGGSSSTRNISIYNPTTYYFAVDPVSDNLIGNGNFDLGPYGWSTGLVPGGDTAPDKILWLPIDVPTQRVASQVLELGTPDSPLLLTFDYNASASLSNILVRLNGITIATVNGVAKTASYQHFSVYLDDPHLRNLTNPLFEFEAVPASGPGSGALVYLNNASLIAVPEPATLSLAALAALPLLGRRRRSSVPSLFRPAATLSRPSSNQRTP